MRTFWFFLLTTTQNKEHQTIMRRWTNEHPQAMPQKHLRHAKPQRHKTRDHGVGHALVRKSVKESLCGRDIDKQTLLCSTTAALLQHALKDEECGEYYMGQREFVEVMALVDEATHSRSIPMQRRHSYHPRSRLPAQVACTLCWSNSSLLWSTGSATGPEDSSEDILLSPIRLTTCLIQTYIRVRRPAPGIRINKRPA